MCTTADNDEVGMDKLPPVAAAKQKALEAEIAHLRQRLQESEQIRSLQAEVDQMQRVLFEKQSARSSVAADIVAESPVRCHRRHLIKPHMPDYIPWALGSLDAPKQLHLPHTAFSFLANKDLWLNLVRVAAAPTHVRVPPVFALSSSHSADTILVGRDFLRDFLTGWRQHNCHYIIVTYAKENESIGFYATADFWRFVGRESDLLILQSQQTAGGVAVDPESVAAQCDHAGEVVRTTLKHWNELVEKWAQAMAPHPPPHPKESEGRASGSQPVPTPSPPALSVKASSENPRVEMGSEVQPASQVANL